MTPCLKPKTNHVVSFWGSHFCDKFGGHLELKGKISPTSSSLHLSPGFKQTTDSLEFLPVVTQTWGFLKSDQTLSGAVDEYTPEI